MGKSNIITSNPDILGGKPVFKGTRVPVSNLIEYLESGSTVNDFLLGFPTVKQKQVKEVLHLLSKHLLESVKNENTARRTLRRKTKITV